MLSLFVIVLLSAVFFYSNIYADSYEEIFDVPVTLAPLPQGWTLIKAGNFMMGSESPEHTELERPVHKVELSRSFLLKKTEVTQGEWNSLMDNKNPSKFNECGSDCPVEQVNWWESLAYCNALSQRENFEECYSLSECNNKKPGEGMECKSVKFAGLDCKGYRLPTEAEWEYSARAGNSYKEYLDNLDNVAWFVGNSEQKTHPVGKKLANSWGLYDMFGNVYEWTWDWLGDDYYSDKDSEKNKNKNPLGPDTGEYKVSRGGSWNCYPDFFRPSLRIGDMPDYRYSILGFRPARTVLAEKPSDSIDNQENTDANKLKKTALEQEQCEKEREEILKTIEQNQACQTASDCRGIDLGCPFRCTLVVNRDVDPEELELRAENYRQFCNSCTTYCPRGKLRKFCHNGKCSGANQHYVPN